MDSDSRDIIIALFCSSITLGLVLFVLGLIWKSSWGWMIGGIVLASVSAGFFDLIRYKTDLLN